MTRQARKSVARRANLETKETEAHTVQEAQAQGLRGRSQTSDAGSGKRCRPTAAVTTTTPEKSWRASKSGMRDMLGWKEELEDKYVQTDAGTARKAGNVMYWVYDYVEACATMGGYVDIENMEKDIIRNMYPGVQAWSELDIISIDTAGNIEWVVLEENKKLHLQRGGAALERKAMRGQEAEHEQYEASATQGIDSESNEHNSEDQHIAHADMRPADRKKWQSEKKA